MSENHNWNNRIHIVLPVHNRKEVTLACLRQLTQASDRTWKIVVVDDGSTDGTREAIEAAYPEVTLLRGSGSLFWTGAMETGMRHAMQHNTECCVWLNDDLTLGEGALKQVIDLAMERQSIVTGQGVIDLEDGSQWFFPLLYRGKQGLRSVEADVDSPEPISVDCCRGNLVAIPRNVIDRIGYPDGRNIPHVGGDTDYTLRATAAGIPCLTLQGAQFYEQETIREDNRSWLLGTRSLKEFWATSLSRRGNLYPRMLWVYNLRHWKIRGAITFIKAYLRLIAITLFRLVVPSRILHFCFAKHSHAYRAYANRER